MKKLFFTLFGIIALQIGYSQILNPVRFAYTAVKKSGTEYEVHIKSTIQPKWHLYSVNNPEGGAVATEIKFSDVKKGYKIKEVGKLRTVYDKEFKMDQKFYENNVDFVETVNIIKGAHKLSGSITYMVCNDRQCLPPKEIPFEIKL